jgi:PqqD family protein of HPr-rel-A system
MARWQVTTDRIRARRWDDLLVIYNCYSGDTHCIDSVAAAVFGALERRGAATESEIADLVGEGLGALNSRTMTALAALSNLERLRLVKRTS